jgi:outer membrane protein OmpA-like peptidoglycan-associated protein
MAQRTGKCTNYTKCTVAYRNEPISVEGDYVCPECGQPLHAGGPTEKPAKKISPMLIGGAVLALAVIGGVIVFSKRGGEPAKPPQEEQPASQPATSTPEVAVTTPSSEPTAPLTPTPVTPADPIASSPSTPPTPMPPLPSSGAPGLEPVPSSPPPAPEPPPQPVTVEQSVNVDPQSAVNKEIKQEVLRRIEAMPKITDAEKDKLYGHVNKSRGMGKIITIPFASGQSALSAQNAAQLKAATQAPQIAKLVTDPSVVFVILGFADTKGDPKVNEKISTARAESAMQALKDKAGFENVMHPVGMGGSDLFNSGDRAKNRVVEVWAVLP